MFFLAASLPVLQSPSLRPPAVPLVTHDPYFCIWSAADKLTDKNTTHWTGKPHAMASLLRVNGKSFRLMGADPVEIPALPQTGLKITPTQSKYSFDNGTVHVDLTFISPLLPHDLKVMSRPVTYVDYAVKVKGDPNAKVEIYFDLSGMLAVNSGDQLVESSRLGGEVPAIRVGASQQQVLERAGDDLRIEWGHAYLSATQSGTGEFGSGDPKALRKMFETGSVFGPTSRNRGSVKASDEVIGLKLRPVKSGGTLRATVMVAYDDGLSIQYFDEPLKPLWRTTLKTPQALLAAAANEFSTIKGQCEKFDASLSKDLIAVGGQKYADVAILAYRQAIAANKIAADSNGRPLLFPKENFSNGCINTVDVIYPMAPLFFLLGADLAKAIMVPILDYGSSPRWRFPFAPHDLGTYPLATGQVYGGGERTEANQMPVEESGNMILLVAGLAKIEGNADFADKYWPYLKKWADYLKAKGLDPENQLCTDDFMGHLAHNANLSVKAILALGAFGQLANMRGDKALGKQYIDLARSYAKQWEKMAADGNHTRLAFDRKDTWSQKYNMVWDDILGLNLFSKRVKDTEMEFYKTKLNPWGLPLDNRSNGMKVDWLVWTATLNHNKADFETLVAPLWKNLNETNDRVPICDWIHTDTTRMIGMIARPVLGGVYLPFLQEPTLWKKWFKQGPASKEGKGSAERANSQQGRT